MQTFAQQQNRAGYFTATISFCLFGSQFMCSMSVRIMPIFLQSNFSSGKGSFSVDPEQDSVRGESGPVLVSRFMKSGS